MQKPSTTKGPQRLSGLFRKLNEDTLIRYGTIVCLAVLIATAATFFYNPQPRVALKTSSHRIPADLWKGFREDDAYENVRRQVEFGPRPSGSVNLTKTRTFFEKRLERYGWRVERQTFRERPSQEHEELEFVNLVARFPGENANHENSTQRAIVGSHYDTKRRSDIAYLGANNGASSAGVLLELARVLSTAPALAKQVELVFFDGEEAIVDYTETDGLVGSRHYAKALRDSGRASQFRYAIILNIVGSETVSFTLPLDTPSGLASKVRSSSKVLEKEALISSLKHTLLDDHNNIAVIAQIPAIALLDYHYPYLNTAEDTYDKISPASLAFAGQLTLHFLQSYDYDKR